MDCPVTPLKKRLDDINNRITNRISSPWNDEDSRDFGFLNFCYFLILNVLDNLLVDFMSRFLGQDYANIILEIPS